MSKQTISILHGNSRRQMKIKISADVHGELALHRSLEHDVGWTITHVRSGYGLGDDLPYGLARKLLSEANRRPEIWTGLSLPILANSIEYQSAKKWFRKCYRSVVGKPYPRIALPPEIANLIEIESVTA